MHTVNLVVKCKIDCNKNLHLLRKNHTSTAFDFADCTGQTDDCYGLLRKAAHYNEFKCTAPLPFLLVFHVAVESCQVAV